MEGGERVAAGAPTAARPRSRRLEEGHAQMLPEMYFGENGLEFKFAEAEFALSFSPLDAFRNVRAMPPEEGIKVKAAETWHAR